MPTPRKIRLSLLRRVSSISWIEIGSSGDSFRSGAYAISPDFAADDLIEIKFYRECRRRGDRCRAPNVARGPVAPHRCDQKLRRFLLRLTGSCRIDPDWKSPQINTPAKITKTDTTAAETRIESTGIATSF